MGSFALRSYQRDAVEKLRDSFRTGKRAPLFVLPTGGGKTPVFSYIAMQSIARGRRTLILVHRHELLMQASRSLSTFDVAHGLISPRFSQSRDGVQVASVQTMVRRLEKIPTPDLIVVDEAHHATSKSYRSILSAFPDASVLGVTATPSRTDGAGLGKIAGGVFDDLILGPSIADLISEGYLVRPVTYAPPVGIDLSGIKRQMGDYDKHELTERIDKPKITGDTIAHYQRHCPGRPAIAFCVSIQHAEHVASEFRASGIRAVRVDGKMDDTSRRQAIEGLGNGKTDVLTSADLIAEGVDVPIVAATIHLRPTYSLSLWLQQVGRALRPIYAEGFDLSTREGRQAAIAASNKPHALVLDHVGNTMRHGLPDDDRDWNLQGAPARSGANREFPVVRIEQCEKCFFVYETGPEHCPKCNHAQPPKLRKIEFQEGNLEQLTRDQIELARKSARRDQGSAKTLEDLIKLGQSKGYKNPRAWAEHVIAGRRRGWRSEYG